MPLDLTQSGVLDERWSQQVHDGCGGEIVIVVKTAPRIEMAARCKGCPAMWMFPQVDGLPSNWKKPDPATMGSRLILPGRF